MTYAPAVGDRSRIGLAYRAWAEHYNGCVACQRDDWYDPTEGEHMFCTEGQRLFRAWVNLNKIRVAPSVGSQIGGARGQ